MRILGRNWKNCVFTLSQWILKKCKQFSGKFCSIYKICRLVHYSMAIHECRGLIGGLKTPSPIYLIHSKFGLARKCTYGFYNLHLICTNSPKFADLLDSTSIFIWYKYIETVWCLKFENYSKIIFFYYVPDPFALWPSDS